MRSIRWRLTLGLGLVSGILWCAAAAVLYLTLRSGLVAEFDQALEASVQVLEPMTELSEGRMTFDATGEHMPAYEQHDRADYYQLFLPDGSSLARSSSLGRKNLPRKAGSPDRPEHWNLTLPDGSPGRAIGVRFLPGVDEDTPENERGVVQEVVVVVARQRAGLDRTLHRLAILLVLVGVSTAGATALLAGLVVRRGLRPLSRLADRASAIDASTLRLRFPVEGMPAELAPIGGRLNDLLDRLDASFTRERRFSADVAHELRTPIAELRSLAEVALRWPDDPESARAAMEDALAIAFQMESIATGLLALTRWEGGNAPVQRQQVRVAPLVEDVWRPLADRAGARRLSVRFEVPEETSWTTDPVALRSIVRNLLSNALEYTPQDGRIGLIVRSSPAGGTLAVANTTNGLSPDDVPHLFERFWRKDPSRSSSQHSGLGLALAKAYAEALGLRLHATLTGPHELTVELSEAPGSS